MKISVVQMRDAFISELYKYAKENSDIIYITNDQGAISLDKFRSDIPDQFINAGVSEQNIISTATGLSLGGKKVYVYSIASFITLRSFEQIKLDLCAMNIPVTIIGVGACYSYSADGPTHHATEDISIMRSLPNMEIYSPSDSNMARGLVDISLKSSSPIYIRLDREKFPILYDEKDDFSVGFKSIRNGKDICILATGVMTHTALEVAEELKKENLDTKVIDIYRLKPINSKGIIKEIIKNKKIVTLEEHTINGGLGSIIAEIFADFNIRKDLKRIGIEDKFLFGYGSRKKLHIDSGIDKKSIVEKIKEWI